MESERQKVFDYLSDMNIDYEITEHPAVYTIEDMESINIDADNQIVKNLFVRDDKKKRYFLVSVQKDKHADLKALSAELNSRRLSFASESDLHEILGLDKGSVSPLGILNDADCRAEVVLDSDLRHFHRVGIHPNDNTATVWLKPADLEAVIKKHGNIVFYAEI